MTDQPSQRPDSQWPNPSDSDGTPPVPPSGYEPPPFVPPHGSSAPGSDIPPPPLYPGLSAQYGSNQYGGPQYGNDQYGNQYSGAGPYAQPSPYGQQAQYGQPAYYGMQAEPKTLSIASMVCGIASVIMGWLMLPQLAAIITGHMALKREPAGKGMSITGLVLGYLCLLGYGGFWLLLIIGLASYSSSSYGY